MWTWADECPSPDFSDQCQVTVNRFHVRDSSTFVQTGERKYIAYGIGYSEGPICTDIVRFGQDEDIKADNFKFFI